jgi:CDP-glucose 4,6-dehydratase
MTTPAPRDPFWSGRSVFVTGASGLLGGWLVAALLERGARVVALLRDGAPRSMLAREALDRIETVHGSLADPGLLRRSLAEYEVRTVFHLAAQALVGVAKQDPVGTLEANIQGTWNILEAVRHSPGVGEVIIASSDKAYGASSRLPYTEEHPLTGRYPYDVSKSCADLIARMYAETYHLPVGITRCGNLFGGGDLNFSRTVPGAIRATLFNERFVIRSDGLFVRDFIYVRDAVDGYLRLAECLAEDRSLAGEAFNLSLEVRLTVLDLVGRILALMDRRDLPPIVQNTASHEIREQYMTAAKARRVLGWTPRHDLDDGLRETIAWYEKFFSGDVAARARLAAESRLDAAVTTMAAPS